MNSAATRIVVENTVALAVAAFIGVLWCQGALKALRRRVGS